jgi:hypothetical protein
MNKDFLITIFLSNTQGASFQRANVYAKDATDQQKIPFKNDFLNRLKALENRYAVPVSDKDHCCIIQNFAKGLSDSHSSVLANGRLRIGVAQKAVNLFLKFLWSADLIPEPPHCPVDRIVLNELGIDMNWTQLDDIKEYQRIIVSIREVAGDMSLSKWEDDLWRRKAQ